MPSSTSNSEFENDYQTLNRSNSTRVSLKTVAGITIVFSLIVGLYIQLASLVDMNGRAVAMLSALPVVTEQSQKTQTMLIFGSSMVQAGFEPSRFDQAMSNLGKEVVSYNYGVGNLNPEFQAIATRRIRKAFEEENQKLTLALIEFNPFQTTKARNVLGDITRDQNQAVLMSPSELWNITLQDPNRGVRLLTIRYLRNGLSAELLTSGIAMELGEDPVPTEGLAEAQQKRRELGRAFMETLPEGESYFSDTPWNLDWRGGRADKSILTPESDAALHTYADSFRQTPLMQADLQRRIEQGDILELEFHEPLVLAFIEMVNNLNAVSEQMEILLLPRNTDWVVYSPEVQAKLTSLMDRISAATGVPVNDLQDDPRINPQDFVDTTHLSYSSGIDKFTDLLVEEYAEKIH